MLYNETLNAIPLNVYEKVCNSWTVYIVLFVIFLITSIFICSVFIYFHWYLKKDNISTNFNVQPSEFISRRSAVDVFSYNGNILPS